MKIVDLRKNVQKYIAVAVGLGLVIVAVINFFQFKHIADNQPNNYTALHRYETDDFEEVFVNHYRVGSVTYKLYVEFARVAPTANLFVDSEMTVNNVSENRAFDDFHSRLRGASQVENFHEVPVNQNKIAGHNSLNNAPVKLQGENWYLASRQRHDSPPLKWHIYDDGVKSTNDFLLIRTDEREIMFIDITLLPRELQKEIAR